MTSIGEFFSAVNLQSLRIPSSVLFHAACYAQRSNLDFTNAYTDPDSGALCIKQEVCIPNLEALAKNFCDYYWAKESNENYQAFVENYESGLVDYPKHPKDVSLYEFV